MANHVSSYVHFWKISEEGKAKLDELYHRLDGFDDESKWDFAGEDFFGEQRVQDEEGNDISGPGFYSWNIEKMGAKWVTVESCDDDQFQLTSAWSVPFDLIEYIANQVREVDPDVFVTVDYDDEMPNFTGWATWHHGSYDEGREWEWKEIREWMCNNNSELAEMWDEENDDWFEDKEDEARDLLWDEQMEFMEMVKNQTLMEEVNWYEEHEEEILAELAEMEDETI